MIRKSIFTIGLNDRETLRQEIGTEKALEMIVNAVSRYYDGATIYEAIGLFEGRLEKSIRVEVYFSEEQNDRAIMAELLKALNQKSIAYEVAKANSELFEG